MLTPRAAPFKRIVSEGIEQFDIPERTSQQTSYSGEKKNGGAEPQGPQEEDQKEQTADPLTSVK